MNLALFDFDGTISSRDSFLRFLWKVNSQRFLFTSGRHFYAGMLYLFNRFPHHELKEMFLSGVLLGKGMSELDSFAENFCREDVASIIRQPFWKRLQYHQDGGHTVVVVTATPRFILQPWCRHNGIQIIGSELELDEGGLVTGRLAGNNCRGEEKVRRIQEVYDVSRYDQIYAYGDSSDDQPMLGLATDGNSFFKPFR